jgi:hypothetical protein
MYANQAVALPDLLAAFGMTPHSDASKSEQI